MIKIDGQTFNVGVLPFDESAPTLDKYANRSQDGVMRRKLIGVYINSQLQFVPKTDYLDFLRLWDKLTEPVEFHTVELPDGLGTRTVEGYFSNTSRHLLAYIKNRAYYKEIKTEFIPKAPDRR